MPGGEHSSDTCVLRFCRRAYPGHSDPKRMGLKHFSQLCYPNTSNHTQVDKNRLPRMIDRPLPRDHTVLDPASPALPVAVGGCARSGSRAHRPSALGGTRAVQTFGPNRARARVAALPCQPQPERHRRLAGHLDGRTERWRDTGIPAQVSAHAPASGHPSILYGRPP